MVVAVRASHVILRVRDMDRAVAFYRDRVGLAVLSRSPNMSYLDAGSIRLALNAVPDLPEDRSMTEVVFEVDNVRVAYAQMHARSVPFEVEPRVVTQDGARSLVATHFRDPDGHLVSIAGWE